MRYVDEALASSKSVAQSQKRRCQDCQDALIAPRATQTHHGGGGGRGGAGASGAGLGRQRELVVNHDAEDDQHQHCDRTGNDQAAVLAPLPALEQQLLSQQPTEPRAPQTRVECSSPEIMLRAY